MPDGMEVPGAAEDHKKKSILREVMESLIIAVILALLIRTYIFQPFFIPSGSMEPNLRIDDHIIVNKIDYRIWAPQRGDIVVFKYPKDTSRDFVKRLIGLPGEKVEIKNSKVFINGNELKEDYLPRGLKYDNYGPVTVAPDSYLMLGDNRDNSEDSRVWGLLPKNLIIGKAVMIYWPLNRLSILN
ncbi:MAG: signal peptidase I [Bacillota bacterium]